MNCLINFSVESELPRLSTVESETQVASKSTVGSKQKQREEKERQGGMFNSTNIVRGF
jgi:hypothetical protein